MTRVKMIKELYPYPEGHIVDMRDDLARGQNAEFVEICEDQNTPLTYEHNNTPATVTMGDPTDTNDDPAPKSEEVAPINIVL